MKRKLLSAALIGAMLVTSVPAFAANENTGGTSLPFTDVADGAWYYDSVVYAYDKGLMTGTSATEFAPDVTMTRGMIASVLYRLEGNPAMSDGNLGYPYEDVEGDDWYAMPIYWARQNGIMNGYSQTTFGPNDTITREQLAATLYNYTAYKGGDVSARADLSKYADAASISSWAEDVLSWANAEGLVGGMTNTTIDPQSGATRAQVAAIMQRYLGDTEEPEEPQGQTVQLVIGQPDSLQRVTATVDELTPDAVIAALAEETGWNLDLAKPVSIDDDGLATVTLAADGSIYGNPPEPQKDQYFVYDVESWIYGVLNSIAESLHANGWNWVTFAAADGNAIVRPFGDDQFVLMPGFVWDYDVAYESNHENIGQIDSIYVDPYGENNLLGYDGLIVRVGIDDVTIQEGSYVTIYNSDGSVYKRVDLAENAKVFGYLDADDQAYWQSNVNMQGFSRVEIYLGEPLPAGSYNIELDAGALVAPDGRTSVDIPADFWTLNIADYGISGSTIPGGVSTVIQLGTEYTIDIALDGENVDRAVFTCEDGLISSDDTTITLTESGSITFTPEKITDGELRSIYTVYFYKGDEFVAGVDMSAVIAE